MAESPDIRIAQLEQTKTTLLAVTEQAEQMLEARDKRIEELSEQLGRVVDRSMSAGWDRVAADMERDELKRRIADLETEATEHAIRHRQVYDEQARTIADLRSEVNHLSVALEAACSDRDDYRAERDELREKIARVEALADHQFTQNDGPYRMAFRRALDGTA